MNLPFRDRVDVDIDQFAACQRRQTACTETFATCGCEHSANRTARPQQHRAFRGRADGTIIATSARTFFSTRALHMSTLWEMAETLRAEEAAALAAPAPRRSRLREWLAAFRTPVAATAAGAELPIVRRSPVTRLVPREPGPSHLP
ncbi:MAG TPA: hypothetical protein VLB69_06160 [Rudaea sp.]|nr:hypothetical protein [Rudaea sp.]